MDAFAAGARAGDFSQLVSAAMAAGLTASQVQFLYGERLDDLARLPDALKRKAAVDPQALKR